ncbi:MAG: ATP-dependent RecD-like DNA helicase [Verrucomicrobiota bacterium]
MKSVVFHNEENGFTILQLEAEDAVEPITVKGTLPAVVAGERLKARGSWHNDRRFGRQFDAHNLEAVAPHSEEGLQRFLASGLIDGIGKAYAKRIVKKFGTDTLRIIDEESQRLEEIAGIGKERRRRIKDSWQRQRSVRDIMVFLHAHGLSTARALRLYQRYGENAVNVLRENPYRLASDLPGVGFKTADDIARKMGRADDSPARLSAGLLHVLDHANRDGHTALPRPDLLQRAAELLEAPLELLDPILSDLVAKERLVSKPTDQTAPEGLELLYLSDWAIAEKSVADAIQALAQKPSNFPAIEPQRAVAWFERHHQIELGTEQVSAVAGAIQNRLFVITGGPGTGKTTILNAILEILSAKGVQPVLMAPTGRAAKRLTESTGREAFTLHRALEYRPEAGFTRNTHHRLAGDLFVVDEASMVDIELMSHFLSALPDEGSVLLVGDVDQLPSVGPGTVLQDIIESGIAPVARLTEIYRQAQTSQIIKAAHEVNRGRSPTGSESPQGDFFVFRRDGPEAISDTLQVLLEEKIPDRFGLDPRKEIQVLTPMNRNSLGTAELNVRLQNALNPPLSGVIEIERFGTTYRTGDRVIQTQNNYDKEVFNGDIGHLIEITTEPSSIYVRFDDDHVVHYEPAELDELRLAYAITIHKSQGSEFPAVVIPLSTQHFPLLQRNLLYTGLTRGKRLVILVAEARALDLAVSRHDSDRRIGGLLDRLRSI